METVQSLRNRIESAEDLHSVVKTMKSMAAVNIRQYQQAVEALQGYRKAVEFGFQVLVRTNPSILTRYESKPEGPVASLVFGSDQGMAGSLNREIVEHALKTLRGGQYGERRQLTASVGMRVRGELEGAGVRPEAVFALPSSSAGLTAAVEDALAQMEQWREEEGAEEILLFYQRPKGGASYAPATAKMLPVDEAWLRELAKRPWPTNALPDFRGEWQELFADLVRQYFFLALFRAYAESLASENASRLASMQAAENNIDEKIDDLQARYRRRRQSAITEELLDVVSGFEALSDTA